MEEIKRRDFTFSFDSTSSHIARNITPRLNLGEGEWVMALLGFQTYHTVPNITEENNHIYYKKGHSDDWTEYVIPIGAYNIEHLGELLKKKLQDNHVDFDLHGDISTQRAILFSDSEIDFRPENTPADLLGFSHIVYKPNKHHVSDNLVQINKVNVIRVECNITTGSYINGEQGHIIHEFFPGVAPSFKINEVPSTAVYLPITTNYIDSIVLRIIDQDGELIDFREEPISIRLHLKRLD
jgi:hypothetical protein